MVEFEIPKETYSLKSIKNTIYWLSEEYEIILAESGDSYLIKCFNSDDNFFKRFLSSANDFSLRDIIDIETREIKSLVVAKAFFPDLLDFHPVGDFDDPINMDKRNATK